MILLHKQARNLCPELADLLDEKWDEFMALAPFFKAISEALSVLHGNKSKASYVLPAFAHVLEGAKKSKNEQVRRNSL